MGGIGKTALATAVARKVLDDHDATSAFANGVIWIRDVGAASPEVICDGIARTMKNPDIPKLPAQDKAGAMRVLLSGCSLLLVLDDVASPSIALSFAEEYLPNTISVLVTSRTWANGFDDTLIRPLNPEPARALFMQQAEVGAGEETVDKICQLLGYHPLALTVAAGRVRGEMIPLNRLYERLSDEKKRLGVLKLGEENDENVWASVKLSYDALSNEEKRVFLQLAASFSGDSGLELLALACEMGEDDSDDIAGRLVTRSLFDRDLASGRLSLHPLVRDFGRTTLLSHDHDTLLRRNQDTVLSQDTLHSSSQDTLLYGGNLQAYEDRALKAAITYANSYRENTPEHHDRLEAELSNLLGAVDYAQQQQKWSELVTLGARLVNNVLMMRGYWAEHVRVGYLGITAAKEANDDSRHRYFLHNTATVLSNMGKYQEALDLYQQSLDIARKLDDQEGIASTLRNLGVIAQEQGNYKQASEYYGQSLDIARKLGNQEGIGNSLGLLGKVAWGQGDKRGARTRLQEALAIFERLKSPNAELIRQWLAQLDSEDQP